jgi:hypothetical protein
VYTRDDLAFGFYIEATAKRQDDAYYAHWRNFRDRIQAKSLLRDALEGVIESHNLMFTDYYHWHDFDAPIGRFRSSNGSLEVAARGTDTWKPSSISAFGRSIAGLTGKEWVNLHIYARMDRKKAIAMGKDVVGPILVVLDALVPIYLETIA